VYLRTSEVLKRARSVVPVKKQDRRGKNEKRRKRRWRLTKSERTVTGGEKVEKKKKIGETVGRAAGGT